MRSFHAIAIVALVAAALGSCSSSSPSSTSGATVCAPGRQVDCICNDGSPGYQVCEASGSQLGECVCNGPSSAGGGPAGGGSTTGNVDASSGTAGASIGAAGSAAIEAGIRDSGSSVPVETGPGGCTLKGNACTNPIDCCGYDTGTVACVGAPTGRCGSICQLDAECPGQCCRMQSAGFKACSACPPVCTSADTTALVPAHVANPALCASCIASNCCEEVKTCKVGCTSALATCIRGCATECKVPNCRTDNCSGCIYEGDVVCCSICQSDTCMQMCNFRDADAPRSTFGSRRFPRGGRRSRDPPRRRSA